MISPSIALFISIAGILILLRLKIRPGFAVFTGSIIGNSCFKYAALGLPYEKSDYFATTIKKANERYFVLWIDNNTNLNISSWNYENHFPITTTLEVNLFHDLSSVDYSIHDDMVFIVWNKVDMKTKPARSTVQTTIMKLKSGGGEE